jgi:ABC-type nickel/cobalt efflux system permease component RcnA
VQYTAYLKISGLVSFSEDEDEDEDEQEHEHEHEHEHEQEQEHEHEHEHEQEQEQETRRESQPYRPLFFLSSFSFQLRLDAVGSTVKM